MDDLRFVSLTRKHQRRLAGRHRRPDQETEEYPSELPGLEAQREGTNRPDRSNRKPHPAILPGKRTGKPQRGSHHRRKQPKSDDAQFKGDGNGHAVRDLACWQHRPTCPRADACERSFYEGVPGLQPNTGPTVQIPFADFIPYRDDALNGGQTQIELRGQAIGYFGGRMAQHD